MGKSYDSAGFDDRDIEAFKSAESSIVVFEDEDIYSLVIRNIFKNLHFEYSGMGGKPTGYNYQKAKDYIEWNGLPPRSAVPLIDRMFRAFRGGLPDKK